MKVRTCFAVMDTAVRLWKLLPFLIEEGKKKKRHFVVFFSLNAQDVVLGTIPRCEFLFIHC